MFRIFSFCMLSVLFASSAFSQAQPMGWTSVRALGMGNAYTAVVSDSDSLFYNPAGLAKVKGINWTVMDPRGGANGLTGIQTAQKLSASNANIPQILGPLYGQEIWGGGGAKTAITIPDFGMAGFVNTDVGFMPNSPPDPTMQLNSYLDYGYALGAAFDLVPSIWQVGVVGRYVNRTGSTATVGPATLGTLNTTQLQNVLESRGTGYALDFGSNITLPGPISPTMSFVYRDIGNTTFSHDSGASAPPPVNSEMIVGGSLAIKLLLINITPAVDFRYLTSQTLQLGMKVDAGVEIALPLLRLRAGLQQGYYTAGVGLDLGIMRVDAATYGVELGAYPGQMEDRRYMAQLTIELGFDPFRFFGGGSSSSSGSGSGSGDSDSPHLKQRR
jgi:hypothetical protein